MITKEIDGNIFVIDSAFYPVKPGSQVSLTVQVGDFQAGGTSYSWQGKQELGRPNFQDHVVNGGGAKIAGTILHCMTKVLDIRPDTNQTSVTFTLKGGVQDRSFPYGVQVASDHGVAVYQITFIFVEQTQ
jgi:hypothetical protein